MLQLSPLSNYDVVFGQYTIANHLIFSCYLYPYRYSNGAHAGSMMAELPGQQTL